MMQHRGFPYLCGREPGLGVAVSHAHDGWTRLNFYSSRGAVRELKRLITAALRPAAPGEQVIFSHPADAAGIS
ncbi:MAG: hypothetical protein ACYC55_10375, partial [Candidatus Geothermincolia bacterium]